MIFFNILISIIYRTLSILYVPIVFIPFLIFSLINYNWCYLIAQGWGKIGINGLFLKRSISGLENIPTGPVIIAANHTSMLDIQLLLGYLPKKFHFLVKKELFKIPIFRTIITLLGFYAIDRKDPQKAFLEMQKITKNIKENSEAILVFPEGTRNPKGGLLPFKRGMVKIALDSQAPILPIAINGCAKVTVTRFIFQRYPVSIKIGKPIAPPKTKEELNSVNEKVRTAIFEMLDDKGSN